MKILHVSYARVNQNADPHAWLNHLDFFTGILDEMSRDHVVESLHFINYSGIVRKNNVVYHFLKITKPAWILPFRISRYIADCEPDVIIVHGFNATWQVAWLCLHLPRTIRIFIQHHAETGFRFPKSILQKVIDQRVRGYFFTSVVMAAPWLASGQILNGAKVHQVMELSSPFYSPEKELALPEPKMYLWVGRLDANKDPITLIHAFLKFARVDPGVRLRMIFRDGDLLGEIRTILSADEFSGRIILQGPVPHHQLESWYNRSAFIISTSRYESAGAAVCEAMSCGCVPLLSNIPAFRTMTKEGEVGLLFEPGEVEDLFRALVESISMDMISERRKVFDHFKSDLSFRSISGKILKIIESA